MGAGPPGTMAVPTPADRPTVGAGRDRADRDPIGAGRRRSSRRGGPVRGVPGQFRLGRSAPLAAEVESAGLEGNGVTAESPAGGRRGRVEFGRRPSGPVPRM